MLQQYFNELHFSFYIIFKIFLSACLTSSNPQESISAYSHVVPVPHLFSVPLVESTYFPSPWGFPFTFLCSSHHGSSPLKDINGSWEFSLCPPWPKTGQQTIMNG
jgi:hypothetical protein